MKFINNKKIAILLSTYNGENYLKQQLESLINQTNRNWTLYIRDDGSIDSTVDIIKTYVGIYDNFHFVECDINRGAKLSFLYLLSIVESSYYMFCDQDDIWFSNKISVCVEYLLLAEIKYPCMPLLLHTDVMLVNSDLRIIEQSYWEGGNISPNRMKSYNDLAICSYVLGCTTIFNSLAKKISFPENVNCLMHDWWVASNVIKQGKIISLYYPTMYYRQHDKNVCGVSYGKSRLLCSKIRNLNKVCKDNYALYSQLRKMQYGCLLKYVYFKLKVTFKLKLLDNKNYY